MEVGLIAAISGVVGGALGGLGTFLVGMKTSSRDDFRLIIESLQKDNAEIRERIGHLAKDLEHTNEERDRLRAQVIDLQQKVILLESDHQDLPLPMWLKDLHGNMLSLNMAYEETFLHPIGKTASEYIGKTDVDIWGKEVGETYLRHDKMVIRTGRTWRGIEEVPDGSGGVVEWSVMKYIRYAGHVKIGVAGLAIPIPE